MHGILSKLTPPEFYVWAALCAEAKRQNTDRIGAKSMGNNLDLCKSYTRRHLKRILESLQDKKFLVILTTPTNQHADLVVAISGRNRLDIDVRAEGHECPGKGFDGRNLGPARTLATGHQPGENEGGPRLRESAPRVNVQAGVQLSYSLKEKALKALVEMEQRKLLRAVDALTVGELLEVHNRVMGYAPMARAAKRSLKARVYAAIRYMQSVEQVKNPQAWAEGVAKRADYQLERLSWKDGLSGSDGKLPSRQASGAS